MYAVILTGGKQYRVQEGDTIEVEKLDGNPGDKVEFPVLMTSDNGTVVAGADVKAVVTAEIVGNVRTKKIVVFKYKAKKNERKKNGHRQSYTRVKIVKIA
ncbi:MAG: 50S ribosomal protein L21 [Clostridia bacterium]|jgi:large subunit ribosomal protein L21|uniref:50S ribosomal protein L21 n=1 Tax=Pumilibacter muris TaxID=2941510 RepID=UPI00203A6841|nr:50S ribosomal protein L21 [Pumilibacter muris]MCI8595333.1 50S ribosomal protein L21 [Clostridia bacterium]